MKSVVIKEAMNRKGFPRREVPKKKLPYQSSSIAKRLRLVVKLVARYIHAAETPERKAHQISCYENIF